MSQFGPRVWAGRGGATVFGGFSPYISIISVKCWKLEKTKRMAALKVVETDHRDICPVIIAKWILRRNDALRCTVKLSWSLIEGYSAPQTPDTPKTSQFPQNPQNPRGIWAIWVMNLKKVTIIAHIPPIPRGFRGLGGFGRFGGSSCSPQTPRSPKSPRSLKTPQQ